MPSFRALSFAHGDPRAALDKFAQVEFEPGALQLHLGVEQPGPFKRRDHWVLPSGSSRCGRRRWRRLPRWRLLEAARQHFDVQLQALEKPGHRAHVARDRLRDSQRAAPIRRRSRTAHHDRGQHRNAQVRRQRDRQQHDAPPDARRIWRAPASSAAAGATRTTGFPTAARCPPRPRASPACATLKCQCARRAPTASSSGCSAGASSARFHHWRFVDLVTSSVTTPPNKAAMATACHGLLRT